MTLNRITLSDLHFEYTLWKNELDFYKDELSFLEARLIEISTKYSQQVVMKDVEHFQNQFILQRDNIHLLQHKIEAHEKNLVLFAQNNPTEIEKHSFPDHRPFREQMDRQRTLYHDLKKEFFLFMEQKM